RRLQRHAGGASRRARSEDRCPTRQEGRRAPRALSRPAEDQRMRLPNLLLATLLTASLVATATPADARPKLKLGISIYAGWMPHYFAKDTGIYKKWGDKYDVDIDVVEMDYIPSVEAYVAQQVDAVVVTNMEALDMPAKGGIDTTVVVMGDYS